MTVLLHISDTHFGTEEPAVVEGVRRLVREHRPDAVILSGDLTQRARSSQFAAARKFCDSLHVPRLLTLPGNHDLPLYNVAARLVSPYGSYKACFGDNLEPELDFGDVLVIGVNTTRPGRHKDGEVSKEQVERVVQRLERARPNQLRMVVTHQPACVLREKDEKDRLHGGEMALQAWARAAWCSRRSPARRRSPVPAPGCRRSRPCSCHTAKPGARRRCTAAGRGCPAA